MDTNQPLAQFRFHVARAKSLLRNGGWLLGDKLLRLTLGAVVSVLTARHLGPEQFGTLSYALTIGSLLSIVAILGLPSVVVRELVRDPGRTMEIASSAFVARLVAAVFILTGVILVTVAVRSEGTELLLLVSIISSALLFQASDVCDCVNQSRSQNQRTVVARGLPFIGFSLVKLWLISAKMPVVWFAIATVAEAALAGVLVIVMTGPATLSIHAARWSTATSLLSSSKFLLLAGFLNILQARVEIFIIERVLGLEAVGVYSIALRLIELFDMLGTVSLAVLMPWIMSLGDDDRSKHAAMVKLFRGAFILYLLSVPGIVMLAWLSMRLFGSAYAGLPELLLYMILRPLLAYVGLVRSAMLVGAGRTRYVTLYAAAGLGSAVVVGLCLVPLYGLPGAALSGIVSYLISNVLLDAFINRPVASALLEATGLRRTSARPD